jgi:hypothetical protein
MNQAEWTTTCDVAAMLEAVRATASERKFRLFACACAWRVLPLMLREYVHERLPPNHERAMREHTVTDGYRADLHRKCYGVLEVAEGYADAMDCPGKTPWDVMVEMDLEPKWVARDKSCRAEYYRKCALAVEMAASTSVEEALLTYMDSYREHIDYARGAAVAAADAFGALAVWEGSVRLFGAFLDGPVWYPTDNSGELYEMFAMEERMRECADETWCGARDRETSFQADLGRDIFGNPFSPVVVAPAWLKPEVIQLSEAIYKGHRLPHRVLDAGRLAVLADALEEAGCTDPRLLAHFRDQGTHVRGCWALDLLLGRK